jgi:hypothetical protein
VERAKQSTVEKSGKINENRFSFARRNPRAESVSTSAFPDAALNAPSVTASFLRSNKRPLRRRELRYDLCFVSFLPYRPNPATAYTRLVSLGGLGDVVDRCSEIKSAQEEEEKGGKKTHPRQRW